jgi:hypothetical protein
MVMKGPSQRIYGQILIHGFQDQYAIMEIKNVITHLRQGDQKLVHKVEKDLMKGVKYLNNCVMKYWNRSIKQILHDKVVKFIVFFGYIYP